MIVVQLQLEKMFEEVTKIQKLSDEMVRSL